jgi:predicted oxidoreductase
METHMDGNLVHAERRHLGRGGLSCSAVALGCWRLTESDPEAARNLVQHAVDRGLDLVDTADVYGVGPDGSGFGAAEELLGGVLAGSPGLRERIVLATKGGIRPGVPYDSSAAAITEALESSLRRLNTDRIDLYQVHRPDLYAHPEEVAKVLLGLRADGKIREIGVSNYTPASYDAIVHFLGARALATNQVEFSALRPEPMRDGSFDRCLKDGVTPLAWSPLAGGRLATGEGVSEELAAVLDDLAGRESVSRSAIGLAFVLAHPARPVAIVGTQRTDRIDDALTALSVNLDRTDCYRILAAAEGAPLP